jgi:hypothetical protein
MSVANELLTFVRAHREELTLSAYVEASPADPAERRNWRIEFRQQIARTRDALATASADERDAFERCLDRLVDRLPADGARPGGGSWACFCAAGRDTLVLTLPRGVETTIHWGPGPLVVPYLRVAAVEDGLVVQVDREHARISRLMGGALLTLVQLEATAVSDVGPHMGEAPRQGFHSGTRGRSGADEAQRQRREASDRMLGVLRRRLTALAGGGIPLVVGGAPETAAHFYRLLPPGFEGRNILAPAVRMDESPELLPAIVAALDALRTRRQGDRLDALRQAAHASGRAALGLVGTARAAERGAIAELLFSESAWRAHPQEVEELAQRALVDGAEVACVGAGLMHGADGDEDGIVAGLRYPLAAAG